jgi:hypothetical protein
MSATHPVQDDAPPVGTAAGRDALPQFLETGFDAFAQMDSSKKVLPQVRQRESK